MSSGKEGVPVGNVQIPPALVKRMNEYIPKEYATRAEMARYAIRRLIDEIEKTGHA